VQVFRVIELKLVAMGLEPGLLKLIALEPDLLVDDPCVEFLFNT